MRSSLFMYLIITSFALTTGQAQTRPDPLNIFGYFQVSFMQFSEQDFKTNYPEISSNDWLPKQNSFGIQHLNLFLSKNISDHWRAFVNFEFTNSFSSFKNWGTFNLEEVWIRYKPQINILLKISLEHFLKANRIKRHLIKPQGLIMV